MKILFIAIVLLAAFAVVALLIRKRGAAAASDQPWPFYAKKPLTEPEQVLYHRLVRAMPECIVLAQVQLSRILGVKKGFNFGEWHNRINRMSLDYLVCRRDSAVVAAIELDDATHDARREADARKQKALESAGITLIRWRASALPDEAAIRAALAK